MSSKYNNNKKHGNVFKNWLCPSFLLLPKKSELPKLWGGCSPPPPPGPYAFMIKAQSNLATRHCPKFWLSLHSTLDPSPPPLSSPFSAKSQVFSRPFFLPLPGELVSIQQGNFGYPVTGHFVP